MPDGHSRQVSPPSLLQPWSHTGMTGQHACPNTPQNRPRQAVQQRIATVCLDERHLCPIVSAPPSAQLDKQLVDFQKPPNKPQNTETQHKPGACIQPIVKTITYCQAHNTHRCKHGPYTDQQERCGGFLIPTSHQLSVRIIAGTQAIAT